MVDEWAEEEEAKEGELSEEKEPKRKSTSSNSDEVWRHVHKRCIVSLYW